LPESVEHRKIKELIENRLREWFGASIKEYPHSGHELDVYAVTSENVTIYVEIIWSDSRSNFFRDLVMIQQVEADVKLVIASPRVLAREDYRREFSKVVVSQLKIGYSIYSEFLNGQKILDDSNYLDTEVKGIISSLIEWRGRITPKSKSFKPPEIPEVDKVRETLGSNLFPVISLPSVIFSSPTFVNTEQELFATLGNISVPPFILKNKRLYTFDNLKNPSSIFFPIIAYDEITEEESNEWIANEDKRRDLMRLLNLSLKFYILDRGYIRYDKKYRRFVFLLKDGKDNYFKWKPGSRVVPRVLAKRVYGRNGQSYCWHNCAELRFMFIGNQLFLKITPSITFTKDGYEPLPPEKVASLRSQRITKQFNKNFLNNVRLWAKWISKRDVNMNIPAGEEKIVISTSSALVRMNVGIKNDR